MFISIIINQNWISFAHCSIIHLSPLFSSKEIDFSPLLERAFFYPAFLYDGGMSQPDCAMPLQPDWSRFRLGPPAGWPPCLRVTVDIMLNSPAAMLLMWGREQIMVFNPAYAELYDNASLHPPGGDIPTVLPPAWSWNSAVIRQAWDGVASRHCGQPLPYLHDGAVGQQILDLYYTPIRDERGGVAGILCTLAPGRTAAARPAAAAGLDILVVEDNADAQYLVCETLRALGHAVQACTSAEDALPLLAQHGFNVLFTDVSLPGMSGVELARQALRQQPGLALLFASGYGDDFVRHLDFPAGTLQKPYDIEQLQQALGKISPGQR
jgi:CheY-like chemotaxis protein